MATIEHIAGEDREDLVKTAINSFTAMDPGTLVAQQVCLHGALDALRNLIARGCGMEDAIAMQNDVLLTLGMVHGVASKRGIKLPVFTLPIGTAPAQGKVH